MFVPASKNVGGPNVPQDLRRLRRQNLDLCMKMGQPVIFRHMWNLDDVANNLAKQCPVCYDGAYDQVRNDCKSCFGVGYVSTALDPILYYDHYGNTTATNTGIRASKWGGFDKPYLTWMVEPDVAVDVYRINDQGVMVRTYEAQGVAPWTPKLGDNDIAINVTLRSNQIVSTGDRFQLKMVQQVTMRGFGKRMSVTGTPDLIAQTFQMAHIPDGMTYIMNSVPAETTYVS